jgi:hypothetical protein
VATAPQTLEYIEAKLHTDLERGLLHALEGTVQRVNYRQREVTVLGHCRVWHGRLAPDCLLFFDDRPNILRCFHPLDRVRMIYAETGDAIVVKALYAWEK